jgi:hypothetical protein
MVVGIYERVGIFLFLMTILIGVIALTNLKTKRLKDIAKDIFSVIKPAVVSILFGVVELFLSVYFPLFHRTSI